MDKEIEVGKMAIQYRGCPNCTPNIPGDCKLPFIVTEITSSDYGPCRGCGWIYPDNRMVSGCGPSKYHMVSILCVKRIDDLPPEEETTEQREREHSDA